MKKGTPHGLPCLCMVIGMLFSVFPAIYAQDIAKASSIPNFKSSNKTHPLTIGDQVPDLQFQNVLNYKSKKAKLSDFKGKLVILDMWSTWCTACIASFPKMDALQKKFGDKLQILLVNPYQKIDPEQKITSVLDRLKTRTNYYPSLPIPIHDTILNTYFPHQSVPHQVWIDASGKVIAITDASEATEENIKAAIDGDDLNIPIKNDWAFDTKKPLFVDGNGGNADDFLFRSIFTKHLGGVRSVSGVRVNSNDEVTGLFHINKPLRQYVNEAFSELLNNMPQSRIILNVNNPQQYSYEGNPAFAYCYDLTIPPSKFKMGDASRYLKEDLKRYFNISVYKESRKMKCLVITHSGNFSQAISQYTKSDFDLQNSTSKKYIHHFTISDAIKLLDRFDAALICESDSKQVIDIDFPENFDLSDVNALRNFLQKSGFTVREEERLLNVVVISDKD